MDGLIAFESVTQSVEMLTALAELVKAAKHSKNPSLQELFQKLQGEAIRIARAAEGSLDQIVGTFKDYGIDLDKSLREADHSIAKWNLPKKIGFRIQTKRLWRLAAIVKDFYADIEAVFTCAGQQDALHNSVQSAYDFRNRIHELRLGDARIFDIITAIHQPLVDVLKQLES